MADDDGILRSIFTAYGIWAIIGAVVLGLVVWAASDLRAQPGSKVSVLWGMTSFTQNLVAGTRREPVKKKATVALKLEGVGRALTPPVTAQLDLISLKLGVLFTAL
jgi:hypothetical protein